MPNLTNYLLNKKNKSTISSNRIVEYDNEDEHDHEESYNGSLIPSLMSGLLLLGVGMILAGFFFEFINATLLPGFTFEGGFFGIMILLVCIWGMLYGARII